MALDIGYWPRVSEPIAKPPAKTVPVRPATRAAWVRALPLAVLVIGVCLALVFGLDRWLNFDELARRYGVLTAFIAVRPVLSVCIAGLAYAAATAFAAPAGWVLTVAMGLAFGWIEGGIIVVFAATLGSSILFLAARTALYDFFRASAGHWLNRFARGFTADGANYMLFLRLFPVIPFALVNIVPAILGIRYSTFVWTTLVGIIPGTFIYTFAGEGLRMLIKEQARACAANAPPCGKMLDVGTLLTPQILIALGLMAMLSLLPALVRRLRSARPDNS